MDNPFLSNTFVKIWLKHFKENNQTYTFGFIPNLTFLKKALLPIYSNVGLNLTNGMSYTLKNLGSNSIFKNKVFIIYDVPTYFNLELDDFKKNTLSIKKSRQYDDGILTDVSNYDSFDEFFSSKFKSKTKQSIIEKKHLLEKDFDITYSIYDDTITEEQYEFVTEHLKKLITITFNNLKVEDQVLSSWAYYKELMLPLLKEKRAVIITVNDNGSPISMNFNFLSDDILFYAITTFNINYLSYNINHLTILEIVKWCCKNDINIIDFSKGDAESAEYKDRYNTKTDEYQFEHHILYDSKSLIATFYANILFRYFNFKQSLRDKNVNVLYTKLKYIISPNK